MELHLIAGARPNFIKIAPLIRAIEAEQKKGHNISYRLVHTGQHYDPKLSDQFFKQLNIPEPDVNLNVGSGSQAEQTARLMIAYEKELQEFPCDCVVVVGDVNSTMACAIVAKKLQVAVAHVEAGIRSGDMSMPEEINRMVTDSIADWFFTTSEFANTNLRQEGKRDGNIFFVGNTMIDTLISFLDKLEQPDFWEAISLSDKGYLLLTLHRPSNVDDPDVLLDNLHKISQLAQGRKVIFPVHPRTKARLNGMTDKFPNLYFVEPQGYLQFIYLIQRAEAVITDSGGIQEETTCLGIPCLTLRENTERYETVCLGTNELIGADYDLLARSLDQVFSGEWKKGSIPPLWDGKSADRIIKILISIYN